jgi:putative transposase
LHGRLRDECLNTSWFRTLNHVRNTLANWRREYKEERLHSSLDYRTPEEFRHTTGYVNVKSKERFPHSQSRDDDDETKVSKQNQNWETPVSSG